MFLVFYSFSRELKGILPFKLNKLWTNIIIKNYNEQIFNNNNFNFIYENQQKF